MSDQLAPCPFCGGDAAIRNFGPEGKIVVCTECEIGTNFYPTIDAVVAVWNRRLAVKGGVVSVEQIRQAFFSVADIHDGYMLDEGFKAIHALVSSLPTVERVSRNRAKQIVFGWRDSVSSRDRWTGLADKDWSALIDSVHAYASDLGAIATQALQLPAAQVSGVEEAIGLVKDAMDAEHMDDARRYLDQALARLEVE